jgi:hypothetical protein
MKKQTKSRFSTSLQSLGLVFMMLFAMAFACDDNNQTDSGSSNLPVIAGTAWKIDWKRSGPVQTYLFCKSGRWEVISSQFLKHQDIPQHKSGGGLVFGGTYTVKGDTIISRGENEKRDDIYKMSWDGSRLTLDDGSGTLLELYDPQPTECQ